MKRLTAILLILLLCIGQVYAGNASPSYRIRINLAAHRLQLYNYETLVKEFPIAAGKSNSKSPIGNFKIVSNVRNPVWRSYSGAFVQPGPKNPLGIRWLGISAPRGVYGIHGNNVPRSIGTYASGGCIRMYNNDVEYLSTVVSIGTPVQIVYETAELQKDKYNGTEVVIVYPDYYKQKNTAALINKLAESNAGITEKQKQKALRVVAGGMNKLIAVSDTTSILLNGQYLTNEAYVQNNQIFMYYLAAVEAFGLEGDIISELGISTCEMNSRIYINLSEAIKKLGGEIKYDAAADNVNIVLSILKMNGRYLGTYNGSFDKEYLLEASVLNTAKVLDSKTSKASLSLKDICKQNKWNLEVDSLNKLVNLEVPMKLKYNNTLVETIALGDSYYVSAESAKELLTAVDGDINIYNIDKKEYFNVFELAKLFVCEKDAFSTHIELLKPYR